VPAGSAVAAVYARAAVEQEGSRSRREELTLKRSRRPPTAPTSDTSMPFGPLTGVESQIASTCRRAGTPDPGAREVSFERATSRERTAVRVRPKSAGPTRAREGASSRNWEGRWTAVPKTFDHIAEIAPPERRALSFGRQHGEKCDKVRQTLAEEFEIKKREAERARDGKLRRQEIQELVTAGEKDIRLGSTVPRLFQQVPLLSTSESAVQWYLEGGRSGRRRRPPSATVR